MIVDDATFTKSLLAWYDKHGRHDLPWRQTNDPYSIWVSEVMLQQTQVNRVAERYYPQFLKVFPTVYELAASDWETVYPLWKGLGFYSRGRRMLKTAKIVVEKFNGEFPKDLAILSSLPGIGMYTSAAILSFAHNQKHPAIDTNLERIISAIWPTQNISIKAHQLLAHTDESRKWNSAMMDLATAIRRKEPLAGQIAEIITPKIREQFIPKRKQKTSQRRTKKNKFVIEVGAACIWHKGKYLLQTRPEGKSFTGRWEFPGGKREKGETMRDCVKREIQEEVGIDISVRPAFCKTIHDFDRVKLVLHFHRCQVQKGEPKPLEGQELKWVKLEDFAEYQMLETNKDAIEKLKKMRTPTD